MMYMLNKYSSALKRQPLKTKAIQAGVIYFLGDSLTQLLIERPISPSTFTFSFSRSVKMGGIGLFFGGPMQHAWYSLLLPRLLCSKGNKISNLFRGVIMDQTVFTIPFIVGVLALLDLSKGCQMKETIYNLNDRMWDVLCTNWCVWPALQVINQTIVPIPLRALFVSFFGLFWNMYLSYVSSPIHSQHIHLQQITF